MKRRLFSLLLLFSTAALQSCGAVDFTKNPGQQVMALLGLTAAASTNAPAAPYNLQATPISANQVDLVWDSRSSNEKGYKIERSAGSVENYTEISDISISASRSYRDSSGLNPGHRYRYRVRAYNDAGNSDYSIPVDTTIPPSETPVPATPSVLQGEASSASTISLTWLDNADNENGFTIERKATGDPAFTQIATGLAAGTTTYSCSGLNSRTVYYFRVMAFNGSGNSGYSNELSISISPVVPSGLTSSATSSSEVTLAWTDNSNNESGFRVERRTASVTTYTVIASDLPAGSSSYGDSGLLSNTLYYYRVRAHNSFGTSVYSNVTSTTTDYAVPETPASLSATAISSSQIYLSWGVVSGAEGYRVYRASSAGGSYSQVGGDMTGITFTNGSLSPDTTYWYRVSAYNSAGESVQSGAVSAATETGSLPATGDSFVIAVFLQDPLREYNGKINAVNYKNIGINTFLALYQWPSEAEMGNGYNLLAAQALKDNGMKVYAGNDQAAINWNNAHPEFADTFVGYFLGDEPDMFKESGDPVQAAACMPDAWKAAGDALRAADPSRGVWGNFGKGFALDPWNGYAVDPGSTQAADFAKYVEPTTIISSDYYGITDPWEVLNEHGIWTYGRTIDNTEKYSGGRPVVGVLEASAIDAAGKVPNNLYAHMPADLIMPTVWIMVVHGADGLIYFCHNLLDGFVEDGCLYEPGMKEAMQAANASVQQYAAVLATPDLAGTSATTNGAVPVATLTKRLDGATYIFAMGDGNTANIYGQAVTATITVTGGGTRTVEVVGEDRVVSMTNGQIVDHFDAYQRHIYRY